MVALKVNPDVQGYIDGVLDDSIVACKWVKLAIKRHIKDLKTGRKRGLHFDPDDGQYAIDFFKFLKHSKGKWAGKELVLEPWQKFILWVVFGWKKEDGNRRFNICYSEEARKNGKSTFAAGIGLLLLLADGEAGAEVYTVATKLDQAKIIHEEAKRMIKKSPQLSKQARVYHNNIVVENTASKYTPLGRDSDTQDGLNVHGCLADELHAHKTPEMWDVIRSAVGSRTQPLIFAITTAGFNTNGICYEQREYTEKVLEGSIEDDTFFGIIYTLDEGDDWKDESVWIKANPNLGISVSVNDMRNMAREASESPRKLNNFLCKKLNIWVSQEIRWIDMDKWNAGQPEIDPITWREEKLKECIGLPCIGALDLSSTTDISAFLLLFEKPDGGYIAIPWFFIPKDNAAKREHNDRVPYTSWERAGFVTMTPGNSIDYRFIRDRINQLQELYKMQELAYDPYNATHIATELGEEDGFNMIEFRQGMISMNEPAKELERQILSGGIEHGNNPVLKWMASNVSVKEDAAGNIKPIKPQRNSGHKIDGIVTLIMALGRMMFTEGPNDSVYETRGMLAL